MRNGAGEQLSELVPFELVGLATAVDDLDSLPLDFGVLTSLLTITDRLAAQLSGLVGEYDATGLWDNDGATSMRGWLKDHGAMTNRDAADKVKTARRLRSLPVTRLAWESGLLSGGQVEVVVANLKDRTVDLFAEAEADLVPTLSPLSMFDTTMVMQSWAAHAEAVADEQNPPEPPPNTVHRCTTLDGRGELSGSLDAVANAIVERALDEALPAYSADDPKSISERQAEAMVEIMRQYLDTHEQPKGRRNRPHVSVIVGLDHLANGGVGYTSDGAVIDHSIVTMLSCDANLHRVTVDATGAVLDYGRATREISDDLFAALSIRDRGCRWENCDRKPKHTEAHHIEHWTKGGPTTMGNLVLLCSKHHTLIHKGEWAIVLDVPTNTVTVTKAGQEPRVSRPRPHLV
jgi:hypothetical protein